MSFSTKFRRNVKPLIIMNSIFTTGLVEYFVDDKISKIGTTYACFSIVLYFSLIHLFSLPTTTFKENQPFITILTYQIYVYIDYSFHVVTIIFGLLRRKKVRSFTSQLETCIQTMDQLNIPMNLSTCFWQQYYPVLSFIFIIISMISSDYLWLKLLKFSYLYIFFFFYLERYPFMVLLVVDITFVYWMRQIKFGQLNELLKGMLTTTIHSPQHKRVLCMRNRMSDSPSSGIHRTDKSNEDLIKIRKAKEIHLELIKCARNINDAYGLHILFSITTAFILIITTAYDFYCHFLIKYYYPRLFLYITNLYWISYLGFKIIFVSHACTETVTEIRDFTLQVIQNPLSFTTCGLFDLDYTLIRGVIGTVITYFVILIQVGNVSMQTFVENSTFTTNDL
ncbi:gustatory and pheromone receptor 32a-like [Vespula squamosa]|uniref:Gustatory receptor n=1 Tax=Vespula squamosa TaxID=30214 RepID=A0ABD2AXZ3_VESSQ